VKFRVVVLRHGLRKAEKWKIGKLGNAGNGGGKLGTKKIG
jgi:hypothetical protein